MDSTRTMKVKVLEPPTEAQLAYIYKQLNLTPEGLERDVKYLMEWIKQQPHLPDGIEERWVRSSLIARKNSLEKVKESIDLTYSIKSMTPEFFGVRDPLDPELQDHLENQFCYPLPKLTPECSMVLLYRLWDLDSKRYNFIKSLKLTFMMAYVAIMESRCLNWIIIYDLRGITLGHMTTITIPLIKKFLFIAQKVCPVRIKAVHIVYAPSFVNTLVDAFRPFAKKKLMDRVIVHPGGLGTIFNHIPREMFPEDYGGQEIPMKKIHANWKQKFLEYRDWYLMDDNLRVDEKKRPGKPRTHDEMFGFEGSFRKLTVD